MNRRVLLLNWILVISYGCIIFFAFYSSAYSWPTQGSLIWFLFIIFCPSFLYHCVFITYVLKMHKKPHWKKTYRFITLVSGILLAGGLLQLTQQISLARFKTAYAPLIAQVEEKMPNPCDKHYFEIPKVNYYNHTVTQKITSKDKPVADLLYNSQRFMLYFRGGSVDINGSTLFYDSQTHIWSFFHNDEVNKKQQLTERINGLMLCKEF